MCKAWVVRSRVHLWKAITLRCSNDTDKLSHFLDFLHLFPTFTHLIVHLTLSNYAELENDRPHSTIFLLLDALSALERLMLASCKLALIELEATRTSAYPAKTLSITETTFGDIVQFHRFVCAFPSLETLEIGLGVSWPWSSFHGEDRVVESSAFKIGRLQISVGEPVSGVISWLASLRSVDINVLRIDDIPSSFFSFPWGYEAAWDACIPNVRSLELDRGNLDGM